MTRDSNSADHSRRFRSLTSAEASSFPAAEVRQVLHRPSSNVTLARRFCSSHTHSSNHRRGSFRSAKSVPWGLCNLWLSSVSAAAFQYTWNRNASLSHVPHSLNLSTKSPFRLRSQFLSSIYFASKCCFDFDKHFLSQLVARYQHISMKASPANLMASS